MRLAYADPPYVGLAKKRYGDHPDYAGEVDHEALIADLVGYDGWALSASAASLRFLMPLCPSEVRVAAWCKTWAASRPGVGARPAWEPVIFRAARKSAHNEVWDWLACAPQMKSAIVGQKPPQFCRWLFRLLGAAQEDSLADLFPGSGAVARQWLKFQSQGELPFTPNERRRSA